MNQRRFDVLEIAFLFVLQAIVWFWIGFFASPCKAEEWDQADKILFGSFVAANVVDTLQTLDIVRHPVYYETNPIMGNHPSDGVVLLTKAAFVGGMYWLVRDMASDRRKVVLGLATAILIGMVVHNHQIGLRAEF